MNMVQILNGKRKDCLMILTSSNLLALRYCIFCKISQNPQIPLDEIREIVDSFHEDKRNAFLNLTKKEICQILGDDADKTDEAWRKLMVAVGNSYK